MRLCDFPGCGRKHNAKGLCTGHTEQRRRGEELTPLRPKRSKGAPAPLCVFPECGRTTTASFDLCWQHRAQQVRGQELTAIRTYVKGRGYYNSDGYRIVVDPATGRQVGQHRLVMEEILGRRLLKDETVHHLNGERGDNRPENLELWSHSHPYGQRVADKVAWARELLAMYPEF